MTNAKELIAFLIYWAKEMAPEREDLQSVTFTVAELKAALREASENTEAYQEYLKTRSADTAPSDPDTSAKELFGYAQFNEELLRIGEIFDPPTVISFSLEQLKHLREEILNNAETYQGYRTAGAKGGFYESS